MTAGVLQRAAFRRDIETEDEWPGSAPTAPGAGYRIPMTSEGLAKTPLFHNRGALYGQVSQEAPALRGFQAAGPVECEVRYGDLDRLYAMAMGFENPDTDAAGGSPHNLATDEWRHVYECHPDLRSKLWSAGERAASTGSPGDPGHWLASHRKQSRGGIYVSRGVTDVRIWPAMVDSMEFRFTPDDSRVSFQFAGYDLNRADYSSSTWTSYADQDYNDDPGVAKVMLHQLNAKFGTEGGNGWVSENVGVVELVVRLENRLKVDDYDAESGLYILEPWRNGMRTVSGSMLITRYADDTMAGMLNADVAAMLMFDFTGPSLGTNNAKLTLGMPAVKFTSISEPVGGPQIIQQRVEFQAHATTQALGTVWQGASEPFEDVTLTKNDNGEPGELLLSTVNAYDENVFEND